jgi:hypothetical protein
MQTAVAASMPARKARAEERRERPVGAQRTHADEPGDGQENGQPRQRSPRRRIGR